MNNYIKHTVLALLMIISSNKYASDLSFEFVHFDGLSSSFSYNPPMYGIGRSFMFYFNESPFKLTSGFSYTKSPNQEQEFNVTFRSSDVDMTIKNSRNLFMYKIGGSYYPLWNKRTFINPFINLSGGYHSYEAYLHGSVDDYKFKGLYSRDAGFLDFMGVFAEGRIGVEFNFSTLSPWIRQTDFIIQVSVAKIRGTPMTVAHLSHNKPSESDRKMMHGEFENEFTNELVTEYIGFTQRSSIAFNEFNISLIWRYRD